VFQSKAWEREGSSEVIVMKEHEKLTSESLAALIIDALVDAGIVKIEDTDRSIEIATEEIDVRKAAGDY
jgi:hypothetical protein